MKNIFINNYLDEVKNIAASISTQDIENFIEKIRIIKNNNGRLFFIGVGGSAGNASHAVNDFRKILNIESYAITDNVSELTARINDDGWETSFSNWLKTSRLNFNDGIVIFSVGGGTENTSKNIVKAIDCAKERNAKVLSIVSRDGGYSKINSDACILIPVMSQERITPHAEEWQAILWHLVVTYLKD